MHTRTQRCMHTIDEATAVHAMHCRSCDTCGSGNLEWDLAVTLTVSGTDLRCFTPATTQLFSEPSEKAFVASWTAMDEETKTQYLSSLVGTLVRFLAWKGQAGPVVNTIQKYPVQLPTTPSNEARPAKKAKHYSDDVF